MKSASVVAVAAALFAAIPANAQVVDFATIKCKEFAAFPKETIDLIAIWLDGYASDSDEPDSMKVDLNAVKAAGAKLKAHCTQKPETGLLAAAEEALDK